MKPLESYHIAWLRHHPSRDELWLRDRLADGFDVHHLDGDHSNDAPNNLVLIEHEDHMRLHGMTNSCRLRRISSAGPRPETLRRGEEAYRKRLSGESWRSIGRRGFSAAKVFAKAANAVWPPEVDG